MLNHHGYVLFTCLSVLILHGVRSADYTLGMDSESTCTKTHYYEKGDIFTASVNGKVHDGHCPLTFLQSGSWGAGSTYSEPCLSLCVKIVSYTLDSCQVNMAYHDGLSDFTPVTFDCHTFPPVMWCSSKNDLKVTVSELKNYHGKNYAITLEITPFCGSIKDHTTDPSVIVQPQPNSNAINRTALIIGAVVGTISILFVLGWVMYCCKHRNGNQMFSNGSSHTTQGPHVERSSRGTTPNQQGTRYAPVQGYPPSSQSSSDRGVSSPYKGDLDRSVPSMGGGGITGNLGSERRLYSPFQPPQPSQRTPFPGHQGQQQVLYSDLDRGMGGDKWYTGALVDAPNSSHPDMAPPAVYSSANPGPGGQMSYLTQNQVYKYPQFNNADGDMHTVPTDTRFVVYDFDYETQPTERKYSSGKSHNTPHRDSPIKDVDRPRQREITPLREMSRRLPPMSASRVVAPVDSTTTDHTSDYDSTASGTTEDDTTTDDQALPGPRYNFAPPYSFVTQPGLRPQENSRLYDPRNFQRVDSNLSRTSDHRSIQSASAQSDRNEPSVDRAEFDQSVNKLESRTSVERDTGEPNLGQLSESAKEGPMPQVPTLPKDFQRPTRPEGSQDLPWPHGPPPPYSLNDRFVV